uniref:Si:ch211-66g24.1 n=1 Tax=Iconisemion striatum TaxID=60296 RepID=A0A1A7WY99_9TELE
MLERLQSALKTVKESKPASLLPHRFVTVRRSSPAAKSGQIRAGDRLEAVEGRSVVTLPHRELAQILRRAGNTLRLTIVPRPSTYSSNLSETAEHDQGHKNRKGQRSRPKRDSRYYSVDLDRGPSGFGFSLRGGSEYNMGLYVLGLMEGGPASRSKKIQVSDQLVEINGDSTAGMTHSQAVEMIRRGGQRIHLVLKRGNGYVPDYVELSSLSLCMTNSKLGEPCFYVIGRTENMRPREERDEMRKQRSQSLPRDTARKYDQVDNRTVRGHDGNKEKRSSRDRERRSKSRVRKTKSEGEKPEQEEEQGAAALEEKVGTPVREVGRRVSFEEIDDDVFMPIPSPTRRLPRPKENRKGDADRHWDMAAEYRELRRDKEQDDDWDKAHYTKLDRDEENDDTHFVTFGRPFPGVAVASQRKPFSFLTSTLSMDQLGDDESELGSEDSVSAASVSGSSLSARALPGPWLLPSQQRPVVEENRRPRSRTEPGGRRSAVS